MADEFTQVLQRLIAIFRDSALIVGASSPARLNPDQVVDYTSEEWAVADPEIDNPEAGDLPRFVIEQAGFTATYYQNTSVQIVQKYNFWISTDTLRVGGEVGSEMPTLNTMKRCVLWTLFGQPDDTLNLSPLVETFDVIAGRETRQDIMRERGGRKWIGMCAVNVTMNISRADCAAAVQTGV